MLLEHGGQLRTVCATRLNHESSRSHAIFTLKLTQRVPIEDGDDGHGGADAAAGGGAGGAGGATRYREKVSRVHLVDLAGSERAKRSGGGRIAETGAINRSLSTLGAVIHALAAGKRTHVPYRESVLTYLLRDGLGGNARTLMLATVSPSAADSSETLSTLRYADSAKHILNHALINLDSSATLVTQLKGEILSLRAQLEAAGGAPASAGAAGGAGGPIGGGGSAADDAASARIRERLEQTEGLLAEASMSWGEKLAQAEELANVRMAMLTRMEGQVRPPRPCPKAPLTATPLPQGASYRAAHILPRRPRRLFPFTHIILALCSPYAHPLVSVVRVCDGRCPS